MYVCYVIYETLRVATDIIISTDIRIYIYIYNTYGTHILRRVNPRRHARAPAELVADSQTPRPTRGFTIMNLNHVLKLSNLYSNGGRYHARPLGN